MEKEIGRNVTSCEMNLEVSESETILSKGFQSKKLEGFSTRDHPNAWMFVGEWKQTVSPTFLEINALGGTRQVMKQHTDLTDEFLRN